MFYDDMTLSQRLDKTTLLSSTGTTIAWSNTLAQKPDRHLYVTVSAEELHFRLVRQQSRVDHHNSYLTTLDETIQTLCSAIVATRTKITALSQRNVLVRQRLLQMMCKLELCRGKGTVLQSSECLAIDKV